jgi:myosin heavy subunit
VVAKPKGQQPEGLSEWLENELRDTKARLHKVEGELEQALKHAWSLESEIRKIHEAMNVSGSAVSQISAMREEVRQVRDHLSKLQDRQAAISNRTEEAVRQRQADSGRDKQDISTLTKQIEGVGRGVDQFDSRLKSLEESVRRRKTALPPRASEPGGRAPVRGHRRPRPAQPGGRRSPRTGRCPAHRRHRFSPQSRRELDDKIKSSSRHAARGRAPRQDRHPR